MFGLECFSPKEMARNLWSRGIETGNFEYGQLPNRNSLPRNFIPYQNPYLYGHRLVCVLS